DSINQLLTTDYTYTDGTLDSVPFRSMQYAYDILGNLTQKNTVRRSMQGQTLLEEPNPADEFYKTWFGTASYGAGGNAGPDAMSSAGDGAGNSITINYDNAGNMLDLTVLSTSDGSKVFTYEWDEFNRLKYAKRTGTNVSDYEALYNYDYGSVRIGKIEKKLVDQTVNYETTLYVNDAVEERLIRKSASLTEYELVRYIFDGSRLLRLDWNNTGSDSAFTRRWMHPDHLGTASLISNDAGDAESITIYLPYGAVLEEKSETGFRDPYGFTGKELEVDLGIMYFGARWYNPQLGRWLSPDPLYLVSTAKNGEKEQNLYHYAANNPWKFVDPNGLWNDLTLPGIYKGHRNMGKSPTEAAECTATVYRRAGAMALITAAAIGGAAIASKIAAIVTVYQVAVKSYIALSVMSVAQKVNLNRALTSFQNYFATLSRTISQNRLAISIKDVSILAKEQIKYFNAIGSHNRVIYKITEQVTKNNVVIDKLAKLREKAIAVGGNTRWGLHESRFFNNIKDHFKYSDQIAYFMEKSGYIFRWPSGKIMQHTTEIRNLVINAKKFLKAYENSKVKLWPKEMQIYYKELSNHARKVVDFVDKVDKATKK
ncbi:hypothetical protein KKD49_14220, partial [Myxococcota bacterium]|nr:hypothetical protein [Myxococcota bacterium]